MAFLQIGPLGERIRAQWNRDLGWAWPPRLLVSMFASLGVAGWLLLALFGRDPDLDDVLALALFLAFAAHGWSLRGVVRIVAAEMEAGTMELLLLTRIRPRDLVFGQFVYGLAGSMVAVTGLVPWLTVGWCHAGFPMAHVGWWVAVWVMSGMALNAVYLVAASFGRTLSVGGMGAIGAGYLLVTTQGIVGGLMRSGTTAGFETSASRMMAMLGMVAGAGALVAWWRLVRAIRMSGTVMSKRKRRWVGAPRRPGPERRRVLLEGNPIEWLASAGCPWWAWVVVAAGIAVPAWEGTLASREVFRAMGWVRGGLLILLSFQAFGQLRYDLKEGTWEALLRTPVTVGQYVMGHLRAWWRQQAPLLGVVATLPAAVALAVDRGAMSWGEWSGILAAGVLLTAADACLASIWFLGAAVKYAGGSFLFAAVLAAGILALMQCIHLEGGLGMVWPWMWAGIAGVIFVASREVVCREIGDQLEASSGVERRKPPGWVWEG